MTFLILKSLGLMLGAFVIFAWLGWNLARRATSHRSAFDRPTPVFFEASELAAVAAAMAAAEEDMVAEKPVPASPVSYLDAAAEAFTTGVFVPFKVPEVEKATEKEADKVSDKAPYTPLQTAPRFETAASQIASNVVIHSEGFSLQRRASSLATMTPESVQAAVQQAGTGLEPVRVGVPQTTPDDLTVISGIDPARQLELNGLGIFYFWQVAGWSPENVAWMANRLLSPERVTRENWMSQAARLAKLH
jgi:predicted flap endonuclease-1-like 5' DNA nuclease